VASSSSLSFFRLPFSSTSLRGSKRITRAAVFLGRKDGVRNLTVHLPGRTSFAPSFR
jgi:hypothetical protein